MKSPHITLQHLRDVLFFSSFALLVACGGSGSGSSQNEDDNNEDDADPFEVLGALPTEVKHPANNQPNAEKTQLGMMLYWDPILSGNQDVACATCHHPSMGFAENIQLSKGVGASGLGENRTGGDLVKRNAPTVINTAFNGINAAHEYTPENAPMFWDNRALSLESQAVLPIFSKEEMRGADIAEDELFTVLIARLEAIPQYRTLFQAAFNDSAITQERIAQAIASFERTIIANNSPFDQYMRGNDSALNETEKEGLENFMEAGCADCHNGPMLSNYELHVVGVPESDESNLLTEVDRGAGNFEFRTPTLRNLSVSAPYMHNGAFDTLEEVIQFYFDAAEGEDIHPELQLTDLDPDIRDLELDDDDDGDEEEEEEEEEDENEAEEENENEDLAALISFLRTLDDNRFDQTVPSSVPSGLTPGGFITNDET